MTKKSFFVILFLINCSFVFSINLNAYSLVDNLRIRLEPGVSGTVQGKIMKNEQFTIIEISRKDYIDSIESFWLRIITKEGINGFVFGGYIGFKITQGYYGGDNAEKVLKLAEELYVNNYYVSIYTETKSVLKESNALGITQEESEHQFESYKNSIIIGTFIQERNIGMYGPNKDRLEGILVYPDFRGRIIPGLGGAAQAKSIDYYFNAFSFSDFVNSKDPLNLSVTFTEDYFNGDHNDENNWTENIQNHVFHCVFFKHKK